MYPDIERRRQMPLTITLHADSLSVAADNVEAICNWFIETGRHSNHNAFHPPIDIKTTILRNRSSLPWSTHLAALNASDVGDGSGFRHLYEISLDEHVIKGFTGEEWHPSMLDLELHALLGRDVFVTADPELLAPIGSSDLKSHRERLLNKTLVLRLAEAQRYVDLYLKEFRDYRVRPNLSMGQSGYYVKRLRDAIPAFSQAWSYMVFGKEALPRGRYLEEFMNTLSHRLTWQMRAHDRIGWLRYSPSNNAVVDEMVYHLNYFIMLTTGVFDCLAWLAYHRFQLKADKRSVSLRDLPTSRKQQRFLDIIANSAPSLADYLRTPYVQKSTTLVLWPT